MAEYTILEVGEVKIYNTDIERALDDACEELGITDLKAEGQRPWKAALQLVGKSVFPDRSILKDKNLVKLPNNKILTNNNKYNYELINNLCDYYIMLSNKYNKLVSVIAFAFMINIDYENITGWKDEDSNDLRFLIWKKLHNYREDCLKDKNYDSNNVVGSISIGNNEYNWNMPGVSKEFVHQKALPASELKKLNLLNATNCQTIEVIEGD